MTGVYLGLSFSGFWEYDDSTWYDLTDMIYSQVGEGNSFKSAFIFSISFISTLDQYFTFSLRTISSFRTHGALGGGYGFSKSFLCYPHIFGTFYK